MSEGKMSADESLWQWEGGWKWGAGSSLEVSSSPWHAVTAGVGAVSPRGDSPGVRQGEEGASFPLAVAAGGGQEPAAAAGAVPKVGTTGLGARQRFIAPVVVGEKLHPT